MNCWNQTIPGLIDQSFVRTIIFKPLSPHDALKHHFTSMKTDLIFLQLRSFRRQKSMQLLIKYMPSFFIFSPTPRQLYPIQVENCDSNSRLVVDEDDNGKFRSERVIRFHERYPVITRVNFVTDILQVILDKVGATGTDSYTRVTFLSQTNGNTTISVGPPVRGSIFPSVGDIWR